MRSLSEADPVCCPEFDPTLWDDKLLDWQNKMYMWYTTCPKFAKKYGKNYVAIVSQVD